eukprot:CAMPEP_0195520862 /NCGR_PEP_ID=MMETSP0794_2-20130614/17587_1 /TAXON_ID=515487 /ORGANISM="Stephanopyxis turris, Strain CCMP 815" /LENGTH=282 /DNA_ID=CAMNT_0040650297 /DNA_START=395 /DNA_END=1243 /DNA_ORIENTATION=-
MAQRRGKPRGPLRTIEVKPPMNDGIEQDPLRVVTQNPDGKDEPLGVMSKSEALLKAKELGGLDLILINPNADPPVCKIVDYSKYRYMKEKQAKEKKKNSKASEVKEVKMSYKIDTHDYMVRKKSAEKFLCQGNRVKCTVLFRGREVQHEKLGFTLLSKLADDLEKVCTMEGKPKRNGRQVSCFIIPKPEVLKSINEKKRAAERATRRERKKSKDAMQAKEQEEKDKKAMKQRAANDAKAAAASAAAAGAALLNEESDDGDNDDSKTLDELLGGDDLTDDLFG